ncbi:glycerate kinase [Ignatzschineria sp. RMDPL8A]|uniref:glycerate kinase n=1 Tax=Ignatzschineria sp. RMDPL8A TaxID=2999236 RepID=UPI00244667E9|nr:glycerate kinase [Ignatzschineria sp. RMDPL8A]MDG9729413.1 glycerate kinase [Ignatzschineria sp. RMDPL8A]
MKQDKVSIVIAPDAFKESLTADEAATAIAEGFKRVLPEADYHLAAVSDGGEGLIETMLFAKEGSRIKASAHDPIGRKIESEFGWVDSEQLAIIEIAKVSGIELISPFDRNPLHTTSFGTGELILAALDHGAKKILIGLGGSATNDGGVGMLQALGVQFFDHNGNPLGQGGRALLELAEIDLSKLDPRLFNVEVEVACDVKNPLTGTNGASAVFGPQKGATPQMVGMLDRALGQFADVVKHDMGKEIDNIQGAGAAGGMGAALMGFLDAKLHSGIELVIEHLNLRNHIKSADLVITGEGQLDEQTLFGKTPIGVAECAKEYGVPVIGVAGALGANSEKLLEAGFNAIFSCSPGVITLDDALKNGGENLTALSENIARLIAFNLPKAMH